MPTVTEFQKSPPNPSVVAAEAAAKAITDAQQPPPQPTPTPSTESPPSTPTEPKATPAPDAKATAPAWWTSLDAADEKELRRHPKVAGLVGTQLERDREKLLKAERAKWEAEREQANRDRQRAAEDARLEQLRVSDKYAYADAMGERKAAEARTDAERQRTIRDETAWLESLDLPEAVVAEFRGKTYPGSWDDGIRAFRKDAMNAYAKHRAEEDADKRIAQREKEIRASERAAVLAELNGGEPAPDVNGGTGKGKSYTPEDVARMSQREYAALGKTQDERLRALGLAR